MLNKVILITGGSSGIGKETVLKFAKNGYDIIFTYNKSESISINFKNEIINSYNVKVSIIKCDISCEDDVKKLYNYVKDNYGKIDVLVNNAGISSDNLFDFKKVEEFKKVIDVNLVGTFSITKYIGSLIKENGSIINISSSNAIDSYYPESIDYDASKAGIISLTHNLAKIYAPNIRVNCICPGWIDTAMNKGLSKNQIEKENKKILLNRFGKPEEIANVIYFLSSEEGSYINDAIIKVDGGRNND